MNAPKLLAILALSALSASAATFDVTTLTDGGPGSLRQAILDANSTSGADTITFSVTGTITLGTNLPAITDHTAIVGPSTNSLTISGSNAFSVFILAEGTSNSLTGLTIANARVRGKYPTAQGTIWARAGGVANDGSLKMLSCVIRDCTADTSRGVGVYNSGDLEIQACTITNCGPLYTMVNGGGIYQTNGSVRIKDSLITNCSAANQTPGGGIYCTGTNALLQLTNTRIEECNKNAIQSDGSAISAGGATTIINDCIITRNPGCHGGGITSGGNLFVTNTTISFNGSNEAGGGAMIGGTAIFSGCTFSSNSCALIGGGGIVNRGDLKMYNCTISGNKCATSSGIGGIIDDFRGYRAKATLLVNCTVVSNTGPRDISALAGVTCANTILGSVTGIVNSVGHNLIINTNSAVITNDITGNIYNVNPMLRPLQNNGGLTWTHALLPGSPAINNGNSGLPTDQRGTLRPATSDIGAYELPNPPDLRIARTAPGHVTLSWPSTPTSVVLQQKINLSAVIWSDVNITPANDGTNTSVTLPTDVNNKLFRLRSP